MVEEKGLKLCGANMVSCNSPSYSPPPVNLNRVTQDGRVKSTLMRGIDL